MSNLILNKGVGKLDEVGGDHAEAGKEGTGKDDGGTGGGHGCGLSGRRGRRLRDVGRLAGGLGASGDRHRAGRLRAGRRRLRNGTVGGGKRDGGDEAGDNGSGRDGGGGSGGARRGSSRDGSGVAGRVLRVLNEDGRALVGIEGEGFLGIDDALEAHIMLASRVVDIRKSIRQRDLVHDVRS